MALVRFIWDERDRVYGGQKVNPTEKSLVCPVPDCAEELQNQTLEETLIGGMVVSQAIDFCAFHGVVGCDPAVIN